ncbi:hypothetical protein [Dysgonomonas termitidis]|uniref:Uncharacterized protein n=1 Tax=Dysgonomonas termitidis TaxID=1516126 RepID=A0ABV9KTN5_9BACT
MKLDDIQIFLLPLCGFSYEESQNFSLAELNRLWKKGKITKYKLSGFLQDVNDDILVDNTNNWIVIHGLSEVMAEPVVQPGR